MDNHVRFRRSEISERQVDTLIGLCKGIVADGIVNQSEAEFLHGWLIANQHAINENPMMAGLMERVGTMLEDGVLDQDEAAELLSVLRQFSGDDSEIGELIKTTSLPLDDPVPEIEFQDAYFLFTGTCAFGNRRKCEEAIEKLGGHSARTVVKKLDYLVLGTYVTASWKHENFGNKILRAMEYREKFGNPAIVSEVHWAASAGI